MSWGGEGRGAQEWEGGSRSSHAQDKVRFSPAGTGQMPCALASSAPRQVLSPPPTSLPWQRPHCRRVPSSQGLPLLALQAAPGSPKSQSQRIRARSPDHRDCRRAREGGVVSFGGDGGAKGGDAPRLHNVIDRHVPDSRGVQCGFSSGGRGVDEAALDSDSARSSAPVEQGTANFKEGHGERLADPRHGPPSRGDACRLEFAALHRRGGDLPILEIRLRGQQGSGHHH